MSTISGSLPSRSILILLLALTALPQTIRSQSTVCRGSDSTATEIIESVELLVSANDADHQILRDSLSLPAASNPQITLVTNESTCKKVRDAINAAMQTPGQARQIWVVKTTDGYAALDPLQPAGEWMYLFFVSKQYAYKGILLY